MTKLSRDILMDWAVDGIIGWLLIKLADIINKVHILVELLLANQKLFSILCVNHTSSMDLCLNVQLSEVCQDLSSAASFTPFTPHPKHPGMDKTSAVGINHSTELSDWQIYTLLQNYWDLMLGFLFGYRKNIYTYCFNPKNFHFILQNNLHYWSQSCARYECLRHVSWLGSVSPRIIFSDVKSILR